MNDNEFDKYRPSNAMLALQQYRGTQNFSNQTKFQNYNDGAILIN